jgi:hypothetical protein
MASLPLPKTPGTRRLPYLFAGALALALGGALVVAQVLGDRGIPPVAASTDIEVHGIEVDVTGKNPEEARQNGWKLAQREAWKKLGGPAVSDGQLQGLVSAIIVESERLSQRRYIATLGVVFDRARAGGLLGGEGERARSAPMLTLPVLISGGTQTMFEVRNPWQRAWAERQMGASAIDYVRPVGAGGESLLLTYGQTTRRSRAWWTGILDQFGAADVLIPIAKLSYSYPGGPVEGHFTARYGPDSKYLGEFKLRVQSPDQLPQMLNQAVQRFNELYTRALADGALRPDPTLRLEDIQLTPEVRGLIEAARRAEEVEAGASETVPDESALVPNGAATTQQPAAEAAATVNTFTVQVATPDAAAFDAALSAVRGTAGVRGASVSSTAIGGTSVLRVNYAGEIGDLAGALRARGWQVTQGNGALGISR